jgi:hypothetical protein
MHAENRALDEILNANNTVRTRPLESRRLVPLAAVRFSLRRETRSLQRFCYRLASDAEPGRVGPRLIRKSNMIRRSFKPLLKSANLL